MTITFGAWVIPLALTIICLWMMFRPIRDCSGYLGGAFEAMFRLFWLIPIGFIWAVYFAVMYWKSC